MKNKKMKNKKNARNFQPTLNSKQQDKIVKDWKKQYPEDWSKPIWSESDWWKFKEEHDDSESRITKEEEKNETKDN